MAGKREPATAEGQPVTTEQMPQTESTYSTLDRPGGRKAINQRRTNQRQNNESTDLKVEHRTCQTKTEGCGNRLEVCMFNGDPFPFDEWTVIKVNLLENEDPSLSMNVPFLVSKKPIERPLLCFNVIEELIQGQPEQLMQTLTALLAGAIDVPNEKAQTLIEVIRTAEEDECGRLKVGQRVIIIPAVQIAWVQCRVMHRWAL